MNENEQGEPFGFILPRILGQGDEAFRVKLPAQLASELGTMVADLLNGDLNAGQAVADWLKDRIDDPERRSQYFAFKKLLRVLFDAAMRAAQRFDTPPNPRRERSAFGERVAREWDEFCNKVRELFAFDLFRHDDILRFVNEVMLPGKLSAFEEVA